MALNDFSGSKNNGNNGNGGPGGPSGSGGGFGMPNMGGSQMDATEYLINYNDEFKAAGKTLFRDTLVEQTLAVLIGKNKPNPLLIGAAGVGKTRIAEDIAFRIANNDASVPDQLKSYTVYELPLSNLVSGSSFVGQLEEKVKCVVDFASDRKNKVILFIDEIHQLAGDSQTYEKIAQILKPALARGKIKTVGATTLQESSKLSDDPALNRRFSKIIVDELSQAQTCEILEQAKVGFFSHYGNVITFDDKTVKTVVELADQYNNAGSHRPDNALTLLDRTIGEAVVARKKLINQLTISTDPSAQTMLQAVQANPMIPITATLIKNTAIKLMTGTAEVIEIDYDHLREKLNVIHGQDTAIERTITLLKQKENGILVDDTDEDAKQPLTLLYAGSSGVGKTEVVKIIARELTGKKPIVLNMTEYHSSASINRIIGSPPGYVGYTSNGELPFDCLESNPRQVILLDEFEKGHQSVQQLFMRAFDEGFIKTNKGKDIDFSKAIIFATTNAANTNRTESIGFGTTKTAELKTDVKELTKWFVPEMLNRFEDILTFQPISKETFRIILQDRYKAQVEKIRAKHKRVQLLDEIPDSTLDNMVENEYIPEFGARPVRKVVKQYIAEQLS